MNKLIEALEMGKLACETILKNCPTYEQAKWHGRLGMIKKQIAQLEALPPIPQDVYFDMFTLMEIGMIRLAEMGNESKEGRPAAIMSALFHGLPDEEGDKILAALEAVNTARKVQ